GDRSEVLTEALRTRYFRPGVRPPQPMAPERTGCGWIAGYVVGKNVDRVQVTLATEPARPTLTDGSGFFAFVRVPVGEYEVSCGRATGATQSVRVVAGKVTWTRLTH
ncbi:carboxypeptidase regulatory-like domain-containing protein, partial [Candidatus Sumerlaeota bacterium]|nr:carboxypeptidase regulatory-like domain-containing protein [Candidatus Sumerlaeota bacterium]